jgi:hypothetical protein
LPVVLHGYETCSLTLRKQCWLKAFENRISRRISGPKTDENWEWRRLHNEELHSLYRSPNIVRAIKSRDGQVMLPEWKKVGVPSNFGR